MSSSNASLSWNPKEMCYLDKSILNHLIPQNLQKSDGILQHLGA